MNRRVGIWLIGARGSVAATAICGAAALSSGRAAPTGCVTELPDISRAGLAGYGDLVFGGHDVVSIPLTKRAGQLADAGVLPQQLVAAVTRQLEAADAEIRLGHTGEAGVSQRAVVAALTADLQDFSARQGLSQLVVVNVASTERPQDPHPATRSLAELERALDAGTAPLPLSGLYAYAALRAGCPYVNFTPAEGAGLPALSELAVAERLPCAGKDGKTGETLLKATLAPMFASRALRVWSWAGTNLLGGGDGENLGDPEVAASKVRAKSAVLASVLGDGVTAPLHIDYVPDLGEWKTAWDHVSFEGFLGVRMSMQFTWQGCDSALAAPLVLDLARLIARAHELGEAGPVPEFGFFFKDPAGGAEPGLAAQYAALQGWAAQAAAAGAPR